jgi:Autotransporter beta-domain
MFAPTKAVSANNTHLNEKPFEKFAKDFVRLSVVPLPGLSMAQSRRHIMKFFAVMLASAVSTVPASAQAEDGWRIGVSGGTTLYSGDEDPTFAGVSLTREFEQGYVEIGVSMIRGGVTQGVLNAVPVDSEAVTLSGGRSFGDLSLDGYVSLGQRRFDPEIPPAGRVTINGDGSSFAVGGALTYAAYLSDSVMLSPFVMLDYDRVDIGRAIVLPGGDVRTFKTKEDGVTGSVGASLEKLFGDHLIGINAAFVATSNSSAARSGTATRIVAARNAPGRSDEWAEVGASASFAIAQQWRLNLNANRTLGFAGPEPTSLTAGLSFRF